VVTQVPSGGLTSVEQSLVEQVGRGEWLDLAADDEAVGEDAMRSWGESRTCRSSVIRDILRGRLVADPDPHGLRLRGARIAGRLDMDNLTTDVNLELKDCLLEEGLLAQEAHLASVTLTGCQVGHPTEPPLAGDGLTCSVLALDGARVIGHSDDGVVRLTGACISGPLTCSGAELRNDSGPALYADSLQVGHIMDLRGGFTATGSGEDGTVNLRGADISGQLTCSGAELHNRSGPALNADSLKVGQDMYLRGGFTATGSGDYGTVRLSGAHIGGSLECDGAELHYDSGPALHADSVQVGQSIFLRSGFTATGSGEDGTVRLTAAHIGGQLVCIEAVLRNDSGPALSADDLQVGQVMYLSDGFTATGSGDGGAVRMNGARIGGELDCSDAELRNESGPVLNAESLQVDQDMSLTGGFTAGGDDVAIDLAGARVGGAFLFAPTRLKHTGGSHRWLAVNGLTYSGVPAPISAQGWRQLLRHGTPYYAAQPYQQLAAGYRALGDEQQVRQTLMAQRDDQLARTHPGWRERLWGKITKVTLGYGYKPWRALWFLAAVVAVSCVLAVVLGSHGALAQTSKTTTPGRSCTVVQQVSVGLDLNLPVGTSVARVDCDLTKDSGSVTAAWLSAAGWVLRLLAWAFAALFIAGFTSAVRKT
jgi:hypothetical protein